MKARQPFPEGVLLIIYEIFSYLLFSLVQILQFYYFYFVHLYKLNDGTTFNKYNLLCIMYHILRKLTFKLHVHKFEFHVTIHIKIDINFC